MIDGAQMKIALRVLIFFVLMWFFLVLLGGFQQETGFLPPEVGLAQWGPGLAGLLMLVLFRKDGHKLVWWRSPLDLQRFMLATLVPFAAAIVLFAVQNFLRVPASDAGTIPLIAIF
jgi:hypothetical protein